MWAMCDVKHFLSSPCDKIHHKKNIAQNKFIVLFMCEFGIANRG
jgi:hypothetical protein